MRAIPLVLLAGCSSVVPGATPIAPLARPSYATRTTPVSATSVTKQRYGARDLFEPVIVGRERIAREAGWRSESPVIDIAELDYLGHCVKDYVVRTPETARRLLVRAFAHYVVTCDAETGQPSLERPLGVDARDRKSSTDAAFRGALAPGGGGLVLRLTSCNADATFERVTIAGPETRWTSQRLEVRRQDGCDVAELPYTRRLASLLLRATESEASIEFEGARNSIRIDEPLREELRHVIDAVDALTEP